jgi:hypothetical protein
MGGVGRRVGRRCRRQGDGARRERARMHDSSPSGPAHASFFASGRLPAFCVADRLSGERPAAEKGRPAHARARRRVDDESDARPPRQSRHLWIAIGWMLCLGRLPSRAASILLWKKRGCCPLAVSISPTKDLWHPAATFRSATGRRGASLAHVLPSARPARRDGCDLDGRGGPEATGKMHQTLGKEGAAGAGTGSRFFRRGRMTAAECMPGLAHHPPDRDR